MYERLRSPAFERPLRHLLDHWRYLDLEAEVPLPRLMEDVPDLPDRVRGAWGRALERLAEEEDGGAGREVSAWSVFFGTLPRTAPPPLCRPYVTQTAVVRRTLYIRLRIIGFATLWAAEAEQAFRMALDGGIALYGTGRQRVPLRNAEVQAVWGKSVPVPPVPDAVTLRFLTPLAIRRGAAQLGQVTTLPINLWNRLRSAARWLDAEPSEKVAQFRRAASHLDFFDRDLVPVSLKRYSSTTGARASVHRGYVGPLRIEGDLSEIWPLLCFGRFFHAGSGCAFGFGRYEVIPG